MGGAGAVGQATAGPVDDLGEPASVLERGGDHPVAVGVREVLGQHADVVVDVADQLGQLLTQVLGCPLIPPPFTLMLMLKRCSVPVA